MSVRVSLTFQDGIFLAKCDFASRHIPREAGFIFDKFRGCFYSSNVANAARLRSYADELAESAIAKSLISVVPWTGGIPHPRELQPFRYQIEAAKWALSRSRSYLALDPGLGKTICAALILNAAAAPCVYVCPPFLMGNVEAELKKWLTGPKAVRRYDRDKITRATRVVLVPDSVLVWPKPGKTEKQKTLYETQKAKYVKLKNTLRAFTTALPETRIIVDEAHRFKNRESGRTRTLFGGLVPLFQSVTFMSGSPMPNRPLELWPVLSKCAPETIGFRTFHEFGIHYCDAYEGQWGWDYRGASNVSELVEQVCENFMLRIRKDEVLDDLPPKTESVVYLDHKLPPKLADLDRRLLEEMRTKLQDVESLDAAPPMHMSTHRAMIGVEKAPLVARAVREILEDSGESILVFALHRDAIRVLAHELSKFDPLVITGDVDKDERFRLAKEFQSSKEKRLMILNIQAGGVGFNLTKATRVVFAEYAWVPGDNDQAADRAHRIGQRDNVYVQYFVFPDSLDAAVLSTVLRKRKVTDHV